MDDPSGNTNFLQQVFLELTLSVRTGSRRHPLFLLKISLPGTMSGGGNKPVQGRMGQYLVKEISHKEIEKLEKELQENIDRLEVCLW